MLRTHVNNDIYNIYCLIYNNLKLSQICRYGIFSKGLKNVFKTTVVNESSVFELLKFYCIILFHYFFWSPKPKAPLVAYMLGRLRRLSSVYTFKRLPLGNYSADYDLAPRLLNFFHAKTQLSINFFLLINVKMPTHVGILTFMSGKNSILGLSESKKC